MEFRYNPEKNALLLATRSVGFEEIITAINNGNLLTIKAHSNQAKYSNQKIMYVRYLEKIYVVPYVQEADGTIFLKTLFPSSKATKHYLKGGQL